MQNIPENNAIVSAIPELESEVDPALFMQSSSWPLVAWGCVLLVVVLGVLVLCRIRHCKKTAPYVPTPLETALSGLKTLEERLPTMRECGLQISYIVRRYLQGQAMDPALFETHEEFSQRMDSLASIPKECQYDTRYLLEKLADLKYADSREQDPVQARALIEQARALLNRIDEAQLLIPAESKLPPTP